MSTYVRAAELEPAILPKPEPILSYRLRSWRQAPAPGSGAPEFKPGSGSEVKVLGFLFKKHVILLGSAALTYVIGFVTVYILV